MSYVAAGAAVVSAGVGIYKSVKAKKQEKRDRAALEKAKAEQPDYAIQPEFEQNRNLYAGSLGMPQSVQNFYKSVAEQGLTSSIGAMQQFGGGINSLGDLLDKHNQSMERAAVADAQMRIAGVKDFIGANSALAGQRMIQQFGVPNQRSGNDIAGINRSIYGDQASFDSGISDVTGSLGAFMASDASSNLAERWKRTKTNTSPTLYTTPGEVS